MSRLKSIFYAIAVMLLGGTSVFSQEQHAIARPVLSDSSVSDAGNGFEVKLALSQPVVWRVFTLADPPRLVLDFREVDWRGTDAAAILNTARVAGIRTGAFRPGWSRLVIDMSAPFAVHIAEMNTGAENGHAVLNIRLNPVDGPEFRAVSGAPNAADWGTGGAAIKAPERQGDGQITVVLDPGHGGIDPGAQAGNVREADLVLNFAKELRAGLVKTGRFSVVLTRTEDIFVPLDRRITLAHDAKADVFLSIHADSIAEGRATGATVYTLSDTASDEAAAVLAERHNRTDLLAGVDLQNQDDVIATVLMEIVRLDTAPRTERLAKAIVEGIRQGGGGLHKNPLQSAGFSVLRAPDIPSVLIELGYISSASDRALLLSPEWRQATAEGIAKALVAWADADAERENLVRR